MQLRKWKVKDEIIYLPIKWDKDKVMNFLNTDIKVCHICGKVDISIDHYKLHIKDKSDYNLCDATEWDLY